MKRVHPLEIKGGIMRRGKISNLTKSFFEGVYLGSFALLLAA